MSRATKRPLRQVGQAGFTVHLVLTIEHDDGGLDVQKKISLPFAPFAGLFIERTAEAELDVQIDSVFWIEDKAAFIVICHPLTLNGGQPDAMDISSREGWSVR